MKEVQQAEALRLADECDESATHWVHEIDTRFKAAKMLRAQHARIAELEAELEAVGAGGVQALRKLAAAPQAVQAAVPDNWRDQFSESVYEDLSAADNQDVPLEEYPARILNILDAIVGPRHPTVIKWRNDAIRSCIAIAYKYCSDPESHRYLKQDLEAMLAAPAHPAEGVPTLPEGWVPCVINYEGQHPEEIAYGPQIMMDRLKKWLDRYFEMRTHPTLQGLEPIEQRQLAIGQAVERACKELPEGAEIQIYLERGAGTVHMTDWDGNEFDHFDEEHEDFACRINTATDGAIAAEQVAAQAKRVEQKQMADTSLYDKSLVAELMALADTYADTACANGIRSAWAQMARTALEVELMKRTTQAAKHP